jgi:hypothetical protein
MTRKVSSSPRAAGRSSTGAAQELGVSPATVRSWSSGARRIAPQHIEGVRDALHLPQSGERSETVKVGVFPRERLAEAAEGLRQARSRTRKSPREAPERELLDASAALLAEIASNDAALVTWDDALAASADELIACIGELVESLTPSEPPIPSEAALLMARRNAQARWDLLEQTGYLTAEQIAESRSQAKNRAAYASRLRKQGRIFAVAWHSRTLYPAFQFDPVSGEPRPVVRDVLSALPTDDMSEWEIALWWTAANGWLHGGERPLDWIDRDPLLVVEAARHEHEQPPA